ncbi:hypothetical protein BgiMline_000994 [Biomphalaria glabrata]|nr:hypothetical protein BgiBS90_009384 [Biomphalaria glabrata]
MFPACSQHVPSRNCLPNNVHPSLYFSFVQTVHSDYSLSRALQQRSKTPKKNVSPQQSRHGTSLALSCWQLSCQVLCHHCFRQTTSSFPDSPPPLAPLSSPFQPPLS